MPNEVWRTMLEIAEVKTGRNGTSNGHAHAPVPLTDATTPAGLTDLGNAQRLVRRAQGRFRYVESRSQWLRYRGGRFVESVEREIFSEAMAVSNDVLEEASQLPPEATDRKRELSTHAVRSQSASKINATVDLARTLLAVNPDKLDAERDVLNLKNGTLNLSTLDLEPHSPERLLTKRANYAYQPGADCPRWLTFLDRILEGDSERIAFMRRIFGSALLAELAFDRLFVFFGTGANGKSVLLTILRELLGDYAHEAPATALTSRRDDPQGFQLFPLRSARLVTAAETGSGRRLNEELIKASTGGEAITAAPKFGHGETFKPVWKWILATNHRPVIHGQDEGIWRRICFVSFNVTIPVAERVPFARFTADLREELPGILNWALDGLAEYRKGGLAEPRRVLADNEAYRAEQDVLGEWLEERCVLGAGHRAVSGDLFADYAGFCQATGDEPIGKRRFQSSLDERGCTSFKGTAGVRLRAGICLTATCEHDFSGPENSHTDTPKSGNSGVTEPPFQSQSGASGGKMGNFASKNPRVKNFPKVTPLAPLTPLKGDDPPAKCRHGFPPNRCADTCPDRVATAQGKRVRQ